MKEYEQILINTADKYGIKLTDKMLKQFDVYCKFLVEYNNNVNLTAITETQDIYEKHFADSMVCVKYIKQNASVCDIGTGAGFPGVILKIIRPDIKLILVDSLQKRIEFLKQLAEKIELKNIDFLHYRVEDIEFKKMALNSYDVVVARAVARLNTLSEYCLPYVKVGGKFIAYKSEKTDEELTEAKNAIKLLGGITNYVENIKLFDTNRTLVIIDKIQVTNSKYPRGQNKPRKMPL